MNIKNTINRFITKKNSDIKVKDFTFLSSNMRDTVHAREWIPAGKPRGIIQLAHGMQEHMGNYEEFAKYMSSCGWYVTGCDFLGHGDTARDGELGYFYDEDSSEFLILDMRHLAEHARKCCLGVPHVMYGHSFGSFLTRIYISRYRDTDGAVLMGTGDLDLRHTDNILKLVKFHLRRHDGKYRSRLIVAAAFGRKLRRFLPLKNSFDWTTRDKKKVCEYIDNPKNNYMFTLNGFITLMMTIKKSQEVNVALNTPKNIPILIISGTDDAIGDYGKGVHRVDAILRGCGLKNVTLKLYNEARHNLMQETCRNEVYDYIAKWCGEV